MAYDRIMKRHARNRGRNRQILSLPQQDWRGVNAVDDIYSMPGHQITPAQNADLGNPIGSITKVAGFESLFPSLGDGKILGLHGWKHPDGDKFIAAWDKYLYLLSGDSGGIAKSSQEDWEAGEGVHTDIETTPGDIALAMSGEDFSETDTLTADFNGTHSNTVASSDKVILTTTTDEYTKALLHMNGSNGGTTFTDECGNAVSVTGTVTTRTGVKKLGAASALIDRNSYLSLAASSDWHFGTGDFTIEGYVYATELPAGSESHGIFYCGSNYQREYHLSYSGGYLRFRMQDGRLSSDGLTLYAPAQMAINEWRHFEVSRKDNTWYMFWDGILIDSADNSITMPSPGTVFKIGNTSDVNDNHYSWKGYIDEFRITKGLCRHTANFTPPTIEHVITGYVPSGTYTHTAQDVSGVGVTTGLTISYNKTEDTDTAVTVQTRTSADGGVTYGAWTTRASGATLAAAGTDISQWRVQWRAVLTSANPNYTCSINDVTVAGDSGRYTSGNWLSPVYDIGNTPFTATLSWTQNTPEGTSLKWYARGSGGGTVFGDWREVTTSGGAMPLQRYVQIRIVLVGALTATPAVQSLLISYSFSYTQANRLDVSPLGRADNKLTGNRVSIVDYSDRLYCADGLRPFVLYVDDGTITTGTAQAANLVLNGDFSDYTGELNDSDGGTFPGWGDWSIGSGMIGPVSPSPGAPGVAILVTQWGAAWPWSGTGIYQTRTLADIGLAVGDTVSIETRYRMTAQVGATAIIFMNFRRADTTEINTHYLVDNETDVVPYYAVKEKSNIVVPEGAVDVQFYAYVQSTEVYSGQNNLLWLDYFTCVKAKQDAITLAAGASAVNDFYNNAFITITGGLGAGQVRFISGYDGASKTATVSEAWDTVPDATTVYSIGAAVKVRNAGVDQPATACKAADGGGTGLTGAYKYKITFVNRDGYESNPSAASNAVTVTSKSVSLTDIPTGDSTITERKIYRTKSNGAVFYYVDTLENNTATTYSDAKGDTGLTSLMLDNNNIPVNCSLVYSFLTYMFYVFMDELWFSKATEPESVPAIVGDVQNIICPGLILDIKHNPMALIPMGQDFVAPITTSTGFIFDSDPLVDTTTMRIIANSGSLSAWASDICVTSDLRSILAFPSRTGIMALLPGLQEESIESFPLSRNIQTYIDRSVNRETMAGIYHNGRYRVSFQHQADGAPGAQWVTFACDFRQEGREWCGPWTYGASCYVEIGGILYAGDPQAGKIYRMGTGSSFDGANIRMIADTRMLSPQGENFTYRYNNFMVMVSAESDTTELIIKPKVDNREASIVPGKLVDTFAGDKRAGHDNIRSRKFRIPLARGSTLSYRIEDDSTNPLSIQKIITEAEVLPLKR